MFWPDFKQIWNSTDFHKNAESYVM